LKSSYELILDVRTSAHRLIPITVKYKTVSVCCASVNKVNQKPSKQ